MRSPATLSFVIVFVLGAAGACGSAAPSGSPDPNEIEGGTGSPDGKMGPGGEAGTDAAGIDDPPAPKTLTWTPEVSGSTKNLRAVWASGNDVFVVGDVLTILRSTGGGGWVQEKDGIKNSMIYSLYGIWGSGGQIYAGGESSIFSSTGDGLWTWQNASTFVHGVWGSSPNDVYAVGATGTIRHSTDGMTWTKQTSGTNEVLTGVWGSSSADIYVVTDLGSIRHSNGKDPWTRQTANISTSSLTAIWGSGPKDIYAVSYSGDITHSAGDSVWTAQPRATTEHLNAVWGSSSNDVYVAGDNGTILHSTGNGTWTAQASGTKEHLRGIGGTRGSVYVVGEKGTILHGR